ncbi:MAG: hypothetical protein H6978_10625 [Gammaproteobacteria bacterium]|nr:hypothetical protein [Gammaproteobacteria bacterium]
MSMHAMAADRTPDLTGSWLPIATEATGWSPQPMPLTSAGASVLAAYDPNRNDSALFCMPLGTPRNTLVTTPVPLEILQTSKQITFIFEGRGDVRRIFLDGRSHPEDPIANWAGHSVGKWRGNTLEVDTVAMTEESLVDGSGLRHSEQMQVSETFELARQNDGDRLRLTLTITDPSTLTKPIETTRVFRRIPHAEPAETAAYCLMDQWRQYLEQHNRDLGRQLRATGPDHLEGEP